MSIELFLDVGNDYFIIMCDFGGRIMRRFEVVIEGGTKVPLLSQASQKNKKIQKKTGLTRANGNNSKDSNF